MSQQSLAARDLDVLWHPCSQMQDYHGFPPLSIVGAEGCYLDLADGRRVIDGISSWWCAALGHRHPHVTAALASQMERFCHVIQANTTNEGVVRLCERLLAMANGASVAEWGPQAAPGRRPGHFGKVFLTDNGSNGVEIGLKMAIQAQMQNGRPQRTTLAALRNGYHGETVACLALGDCDLYKQHYAELMFPVTMLGPLPYRCGPEDPRWGDAGDAWPVIEAQLAPLADHLAAIVYEPILQGAGGMLVYDPDLLRRLRAWADAHEVYLVADEIAAGMGRCGTMLASHLSGVLPDIAVVSKGLTAGTLPMAAVLVPDAIYDIFLADYHSHRAFMHSNTYTGNALAVAVANAALDVFAADQVLDNVADNGRYMRQALAAMAARRPDLEGVRGIGMMAAVDLRASDGSALDPLHRTGFQVYQRAVQHGALLRNLGDTMYLFPPLTAPRSVIDDLLTALERSLGASQE